MGATLRMGATLSILSIVAFGLRFGRHLQHSKDCLGPVADTLLCLLRVAPIMLLCLLRVAPITWVPRSDDSDDSRRHRYKSSESSDLAPVTVTLRMADA